MKKPVCFYSFVSDNYYDPCGAPQMINSFKRFHPDIPLVIFRQDMVSQIIGDGISTGINWLNAKPAFAKLLTDHYELVVNVDIDTIFLGRLDAVFTKEYDVGSVMNLNDYENRHIEGITDEMYLQAGLVASRIPEFWDIWMARSLRDNWKYMCAENDTLNLVVYEHPEWKLKIFDKDTEYYGCKSLGRETEFKMNGDKVMCRGEQVKCYHAAKGPANMPKLTPEKMKSYGFSDQVIGFATFVGNYGKSVCYDII